MEPQKKSTLRSITLYSILLAVLVLGIVVWIVYTIGKEGVPTQRVHIDTNVEKHDDTVSIASEDIKEENFTGTVAVVRGDNLVASKSREYIKKTVDEFREQANRDVPDIRKQFGADSPTANYTITIEAQYLKNPRTQSVVINTYEYTGGAHGNSYYTVFTSLYNAQSVLSINDVITPSHQDNFINLVKNELLVWSPEGSGYSPVFPDVVKDLTLQDFSAWSIDDENLTIYFSQYAIGPGALGQVAFPVPLSKIKDYLIPSIY
jgi:hypothetical protein